MIGVQILEREDKILPTDFVRYMDIEYTGQSDMVSTQGTYGGSPMNFFRWLRVDKAMMPHFVGKTVGYVEDWQARIEKPHQPIARWEFARGDIPISHQLDQVYKVK